MTFSGGGGRRPKRASSLSHPPGNRYPFKPSSLIGDSVLSRDRTTWMCDLCSCFVHREIEIAPLERMVVTFVGEREGENERADMREIRT